MQSSHLGDDILAKDIPIVHFGLYRGTSGTSSTPSRGRYFEQARQGKGPAILIAHDTKNALQYTKSIGIDHNVNSHVLMGSRLYHNPLNSGAVSILKGINTFRRMPPRTLELWKDTRFTFLERQLSRNIYIRSSR